MDVESLPPGAQFRFHAASDRLGLRPRAYSYPGPPHVAQTLVIVFVIAWAERRAASLRAWAFLDALDDRRCWPRGG